MLPDELAKVTVVLEPEQINGAVAVAVPPVGLATVVAVDEVAVAALQVPLL
jgi:hypothetical protein